MHIPEFQQIATVGERRLVGGPATQSLLPLKYGWLYNIYKKGRNNFWLPEEVGMGEDKLQYATLEPNLRHQYDWLFSMLTTLDEVVTEAVGADIMPHATAPEFRQWLALQCFQEAVHTDSYTMMAEEIGLDPDEVFTRYLQEKPLYDKIEMAGKYAGRLAGLKTETPEQIEEFLCAYAFFPLILEGLWFYMGLSAGTYPSRFARKMLGTSDQFQFIRRDEQLHYNVGLDVIMAILRENPEVNRQRVGEALLDMAYEGMLLEEKFAKATYRDLPGMSAEAYIEHCRFQMKTNLFKLGLVGADYEKSTPALPWISETVDLKREGNFFERRVTEYQVSADLFGPEDPAVSNPSPEGLGWDDPMANFKKGNKDG